MTNLKNIEKLSVKFNKDIEEVKKELKRIQSTKCRLKKQKGKKTYEKEMTEVLKYEQALKEVRQLLDPKEKPVTEYEQADVDRLDYDQIVKAIKSIQSKKTLSRWLTTEDGNNPEYKKAVEIEKMLIERRAKIQPVEKTAVRKTDVQTIVETLESSGNLSKDQVLELLKKLI